MFYCQNGLFMRLHTVTTLPDPGAWAKAEHTRCNKVASCMLGLLSMGGGL